MDDNSNLLNVIDENSAFVPESTITDSSVPSMTVGDSDSGIVEQAQSKASSYYLKSMDVKVELKNKPAAKMRLHD